MRLFRLFVVHCCKPHCLLLSVLMRAQYSWYKAEQSTSRHVCLRDTSETYGTELQGNPYRYGTRHSAGFFPLESPLRYLSFNHISVTVLSPSRSFCPSIFINVGKSYRWMYFLTFSQTTAAQVFGLATAGVVEAKMAPLLSEPFSTNMQCLPNQTLPAAFACEKSLTQTLWWEHYYVVFVVQLHQWEPILLLCSMLGPLMNI